MPNSRDTLSASQQRAAIAAAKEQRNARRDQFSADLSGAKFDQSEDHFQQTEGRQEREFAHRQNTDNEQLSLDQEKQLLDRSKAILEASKERFAVMQQARKMVGAAKAIDYFGSLDHADPEFEKKWYKGMVDHSGVIADPSVSAVYGMKQEDHKLFRTALENRDLATFNGKGQKAYAKVLQETGNPTYANAAGKAAHARGLEEGKALAHPDILNDDLLRTYDPESGGFDVEALNRLTGQRQSLRESGDKTTKQNVDVLGQMTKTLEALRARGAVDAVEAARLKEAGLDAPAPTAESEAFKQARDAVEKYVAGSVKSFAIPEPAGTKVAGTPGTGDTPGLKPIDAATMTAIARKAFQEVGADGWRELARKRATEQGYFIPRAPEAPQPRN